MGILRIAESPESVASEGGLRAAGAQQPQLTCQSMRIASTAGAQVAERSSFTGIRL